MNGAPVVELLWWPGCPSHPRALELLGAEMTALGLDPATVESRPVLTDDEAAREHFTGSPTIRVDGADIDPPPDTTPPALTCRLYLLPDGRPSPLPDRGRIREALARAVS
ncbi:hypothetical protein GCM10009613_63820 [Pseudonocardia kongjuensis]|uniref:Thioredoxin family protein n=1 Tax=Pseudonocardia kongjuensis TaxID=102227 RepID=A0ABN1YBC1_9PSEU